MHQKIWLKRALIPLLVVDIVWTSLAIASFSLGLYLDENADKVYADDEYDQAKKTFNIGTGIILAISVVGLILDLVSVLLWALHRLMPATLVGFNSVKTLFWLVILTLEIIAAANTYYGLAGFVWVVFVLAASLGQLIYGSIILHRHRKGNFATRGAYGPTGAGYEAPPRGSYAAYNSSGSAPVTKPVRNPFSQEPMRGVDDNYASVAPGVAMEYYGSPAV